MKNKQNGLRIIVLLMVIGFLLMSCDLNPEFTWKFVNQSSYTVNISEADVKPSSFTLEPGKSRSFTNSRTSVSCKYEPVNFVDASFSSTLKGGTFTFKNK